MGTEIEGAKLCRWSWRGGGAKLDVPPSCGALGEPAKYSRQSDESVREAVGPSMAVAESESKSARW